MGDRPDVSYGLTTQGLSTQAESAASIENGVYYITNSGKRLDVAGGSKANSAPTQIYADNATPAQRWRIEKQSSGYYRIVAVESGKVLDVRGGSKNSGTVVQQYAWNGTKAQLWKFYKDSRGGYRIVSALDDKMVIDVSGGSSANGAKVQIWGQNNTKAQSWTLSKITAPVSNGFYTLTCSASGRVLDVSGGSFGNGANIWQYNKNSTLAQSFELRYNSNTGYYTIYCAASGKVVDVSGGSSASGANVQQYAGNGTRAQMWSVTKANDGSLTIRNAISGMVLDVSGASKSNGANVQVWWPNGTQAQKWKAAAATNAQTEQLSITLNQMTTWNWIGNEYYRLRVASASALQAYIDPNNASRYEFVDLRKTTATSGAQLNAFITSTSTGRSGVLKGLGPTFVAAARQYGLNQDYLLAHAILESGWGTSTLAQGYAYEGGWIDGKYYPAGTYYNFYGIGAYDTSPLSGGRKMAIINGWNSREKAVYGAAKWIADHYIYRSGNPQYTLYAMKWDYAYTNMYKTYGWHQYATGHDWSSDIADVMSRLYSMTGTSGSLTFVIPRYA